MYSIFRNKQYDAKPQSGGWFLAVRFKKTINDLDWVVRPISTDNLNEEYHNRVVNMNLLENKIDTENYSYTIEHVDNSEYRHTFIYRDKSLHYYKKYNKMDADYTEDKEIPFSFEEACEFIKDEIK